MVAIDAGKLDRLVRVLELRKTPEGWAWAERRKAWARVEGERGRSLFSSVGLGARAYKLTLRRQGLTLHNALLWEGRHLFITQIDPLGRGHLEVRTAAVQLCDCKADVHSEPCGPRFPGVLTEKYLRNEQGHPMDEISTCYVLVTPKQIELDLGGLVDVAGKRYKVLVGHTLDLYKNEYEILRREDA